MILNVHGNEWTAVGDVPVLPPEILQIPNDFRACQGINVQSLGNFGFPSRRILVCISADL